MLNHDQMPADLQQFETTYNHENTGVFLIATDASKQIIGCIASFPYDHRFEELMCSPNTLIYEVCRLYVLPSYRHQKIGRQLFTALKLRLQEQGINQLYLHTHPFLDGAQLFWEKMGFHFLHQDKDAPFFTIHMQQQYS